MRLHPRLHFSFLEAEVLDDDATTSLLGGKGAALARMTAMGLPVPPGFTCTTEACHRFLAGGEFVGFDSMLDEGLAGLEDATGRHLGGGVMPLLVSVRSGAPVSMPGMMDTVLNVGMTDQVAEALGTATGDGWFGWDTARRFVQSYASVVLGAPDVLLRRLSVACLGGDEGRGLGADALGEATGRLRSSLADEGYVIPTDPRAQVGAAVGAVFSSWRSERAAVYREVEAIADTLGTAATVQAMTFGNLGDRSGTGVAFTRDPSTGVRGLVGDFLVGAQGEDVVAGTHATRPIAELRTLWPAVADELEAAAAVLEADLVDLADIEFTVEDGRLWILQVRRGKRSPRAALRIAIDLAEDPEVPIDRAEAVARVAEILDDPPTAADPVSVAYDAAETLAVGLAASPGRATGPLCTDVDEAIAAGARGEPVILVRRETSPADIAGMAEAAGLVTTLGGLVSHAAVVARSWGLPAVVGASAVTVRPDGISVDGKVVPAGEIVTVDGERGVVLLGDHRAEEREVEEVRVLRRWRDELAASPTPAGPTGRGGVAPVEECCRVLALKGMGTAGSVAEVLGCDADEVASIIAELVASGSAQELPGGRVRLLPAAIALVDDRFAAEAARLGPTIEAVLDDFHGVNDELKQVVTAWQMRDVGGGPVTNDHSDADYDAAVVARLRTEVHESILPIIATVAAAEPRFERYRERLDAALAAIERGDGEWFAHPLRDSYHTVWFELHEELIRLTGRTRADEAAAGRG